MPGDEIIAEMPAVVSASATSLTERTVSRGGDSMPPPVDERRHYYMSQLLPPTVEYESREEAAIALKFALLQVHGKCGIRCDSSRSGGSRAVYVCQSIVHTVSTLNSSGQRIDGRTAFNVEVARPAQLEGETTPQFKRRCTRAARKAQACHFLAVLRKLGTKRWIFDTVSTDGQNYIGHDASCWQLGTVPGAVASKLLEEAIHADPKISGRAMHAQLIAKSSPVGAGTAPSASTLYRGRAAVAATSEERYNIYWARLRTYLDEFAEMNPSSSVAYVADARGHFQRYFVSIFSAVNLLRHSGMGFYSIDACHTKHRIADGMQLHFLVGRTGNNTNILVAWSLEAKENADSYSWFAQKCQDAGIGALLEKALGAEQTPVLFSDGHKGTPHFASRFEGLHHARCAKHLASSARVAVKKAGKERNVRVQPFRDGDVIRVCAAKTKADFDSEAGRLQRICPHALEYLHNYTAATFSVFHMAKEKNVACFGQCTSNAVEGFNGTKKVTEARKMHPFLCLVALVKYSCERLSFHRQLCDDLRRTESLSRMLKNCLNVLSEATHAAVIHANTLVRASTTFVKKTAVSKCVSSAMC